MGAGPGISVQSNHNERRNIPLTLGRGASPLTLSPLTLGRGASFLTLGRGASPLTLGRGASFLTFGRGASPLTLGRGASFLSLGRGARYRFQIRESSIVFGTKT